MSVSRSASTHLSRFTTSDRGRQHTNGDDAQPNPWLQHFDPPSPPAAALPAHPEPNQPPTLAPQPGIQAPESGQQLPRRELVTEELSTLVWLVGAHGGAGESSLEQLLTGSRAADHAWPISPDPKRPAITVLVARTSYTGLTAAQRALRDWASGSVAVELIGLVLVADAPGRLPRELRSLVDLIASAAPGRTPLLPWQPDWRFGAPSFERASRSLRELLQLLYPLQEA